MSSSNCSLSQYYCNSCSDTEQGRITGVAWVRKGYTFTDITDLQEWKDVICSNLAVVIAETRGTSDGGAAVEGVGYGRQENRVTGRNFTVSYSHLWGCENQPFYDELNYRNNYEFYYATENYIFRSVNPAFSFAKVAVEESTQSELRFDVDVKWSHRNLPACYLAPGVVDALFSDCEIQRDTLACYTCNPTRIVICS